MDEVITDVNTEIKSGAEMTAGEMLRNARTTGRRKRELQTIAKQLCIREDFLQALEDGNYTALPEVVYILGFARNYAIELGLDPNEVIAKIKHELGLVANDGEEPVLVVKKSESTAPKFDFKKFVPMCKDAWAYIVKHWKWATGIACGVLLLIVLLIVIFSGSDSKTDELSLENAEIVVSSEPSEPAYTQPVRELFGTENRGKATIILQANKTAGDVGTWVQIENARGKIVFTKILAPGDVFYMPAGDGYRGTFGNVAGIDFWVNGKLAPTVKASRNAKVAISEENLMKPVGANNKQ